MLLEPVQGTCPGLDGFLGQLCLLVAGVAPFSTVLLWLTAPSPPSPCIKSLLPAVTTATCCVAEGLPGITTGSCTTCAHQHLQLPLVQVRTQYDSLGLALRGIARSPARAQLSLGIAWPVRVRSSAHCLTRCHPAVSSRRSRLSQATSVRSAQEMIAEALDLHQHSAAGELTLSLP